jgi:hypothetical protein
VQRINHAPHRGFPDESGRCEPDRGLLYFATLRRKTKPIQNTPKNFTVADLNVHGELQLKQAYDYVSLEQIPLAADLIVTMSTAIYRTPAEFELKLLRPGMAFRWKAVADTAGIASLRSEGELASISLLASGIDADADAIVLQAFQSHLLRQLHDSGVEPAFALMNLPERPLVATINFLSPPDERDRMIVALADRCFAAAYFRSLQLA